MDDSDEGEGIAMGSVLDELEESRRSRQLLIRMQLEDDTRADLLAYGMAPKERIGSSGAGPSDPADRWIASIDAEEGRVEKKREATRSLRNGRKLCEGLGAVWGLAVYRFMFRYYVDACHTWSDAFEYAGITESIGYKMRRTALDWAESVGREHVVAGRGIAEDD